MTHNVENQARRSFLSGSLVAGAALAASALAARANTQRPVALDGQANPNGRFAGKAVLITGGTSGIGRTTAEAFAREGAKVVFCGRREALGREVEARIRGFGGEAAYVRADVRNDAEVKALVDACLARHGRLDIAFNNAGYFMDPKTAANLTPGPVHEMSLDHWNNIMATNASGVFYSMRHEIPVMLRQGGGAIVNMASVSGHAAFEGMSGYAASKHAVVGLTKVAAVELAPKNIRVNSISPLAVDTPMIRDSLAFFGVSLEQAAQGSPMRRINTTDEMARAVMFLASDDASSMTGMDLDVTGAFLAK